MATFIYAACPNNSAQKALIDMAPVQKIQNAKAGICTRQPWLYHLNSGFEARFKKEITDYFGKVPGNWAPERPTVLAPLLAKKPLLAKYSKGIPSLERWKMAPAEELPNLNLLVEGIASASGCKTPEVCTGYYLGTHAQFLKPFFTKTSILCLEIDFLDRYAKGEFTLGELRSVIAHEMAHYKKNHVLKNFSLYHFAKIAAPAISIIASAAIVLSGAPVLLAVPVLAAGAAAFKFRQEITNVYSRALEYSADKFAASITGARNLISYFKKTAPEAVLLQAGVEYSVAGIVLKNSRVQQFLAIAMSDHPTNAQRIERLEKIAEKNEKALSPQ